METMVAAAGAACGASLSQPEQLQGGIRATVISCRRGDGGTVVVKACRDAPDAQRRETGRQVFEVQRRAYLVEAEFIGFDGIPPLHEALDDLVAGDHIWIGVRIDGRVVAALAYRLADEACDIDRLFVAPEEVGKGIASALLATLMHHCRMTVSTATDNTTARRLYEKHGFRAVSQHPIAPSVTATQYERRR